MAEEQFYRQMQHAALLLQSGESKNARNAAALLEHLYELCPENTDVALNLGAAYILSKQYRRAIPMLEVAAKTAHHAAVWANLGAAYLGTLQFSSAEQQDNAIAAFNRALEIDPYHPNVHYNLGLIYQDRGDWGNARQMFEGAIRANPADQDAQRLLARIEQFLNDEGPVNSG